MTANHNASVRAIQVDLEVVIHATPDRVWKGLTEEINSWWPKEFYATRSGTRFVFEARVGGRVFEDGGNGTGGIWYTVGFFEPHHSMHLYGHLAPPWGGPATSLVHITLKKSGNEGTLFRLSDSVFGKLDDKSATVIHKGWRDLIEEGLKKFVEGPATS